MVLDIYYFNGLITSMFDADITIGENSYFGNENFLNYIGEDNNLYIYQLTKTNSDEMSSEFEKET